MNGVLEHVGFCVCLLLLSIMFSHCVHVVASVNTSFLFIAKQ